MRSYFIYLLFLTLSLVTVTQAQRSFIQNWQVVQDSALDVLNKDIRTDNESIITAIDNQLNIPFRLHATTPIPDSSLVIGTNQVDLGDGAGLSSPPAASTLQVFPTSSIDYQTGVTSGGTILRDGFAFTLPVCNVGEFYRHVFVYDSATNSVDSSLSAGVALEASLEDPGVLFDLVKGNPLGYIDLECTNVAGAYKTAGSLTDIIENSVASTPKIFRFGSGAGGGVESINDLDDVDIETTLPNIGEALLWDGSLFAPSAIVNSIDDLNDVDVSTAAPTLGQTLAYDGSQFIPKDLGVTEINYITNWDAESGTTTGWVKYEDAVAAIPEDGSGGVTLDQGFIAQNVVVLRGSKSFELNVDANYQGKGVSYDFPIKDQDKNKKLKIQFDFKTDLDAAYLSGDLRVYIYDVDNSLLITPVDTDIIRGVGIFQTSFNSSSSSNYRLIFHIANSTSPWKAYIDQIIIGPGMTSQGVVVDSWKNFSPILENFGENDIDGYYRRVGDSLEVRIGANQSGAAVAGNVRFDFNTNFGLNIDQDFYTTSFNRNIVGHGYWHNGGTAVVGLSANVNQSGADYIEFYRHDTSQDNLEGVDLATNDKLTMTFTVAIQQYKNQAIVPMLSEDNLSEWQAFDGFVNDRTGTATVTYTDRSCHYRRVGDELEVTGQITISTISGASTPVVGLPSGLNIDTTKIEAFALVGTGTFGDVSAATTFNIAFAPDYSTGRTNEMFIRSVDGSTIPALGANDQIRFSFKVPIAEWSGSQNSLVGYSLYNPDVQTGLVDSKGLKGHTNGSAIAAGYVGEKISTYEYSAGAGATAPALSAGNTLSVVSLDLTPGVWMLKGTAIQSDFTAGRFYIGGFSNTFNTQGAFSEGLQSPKTTDYDSSTGGGGVTHTAIINISESDTWYFNVFVSAINGANNCYYYFEAVRIS